LSDDLQEFLETTGREVAASRGIDEE